jgi:hypothetical protein
VMTVATEPPTLVTSPMTLPAPLVTNQVSCALWDGVMRLCPWTASSLSYEGMGFLA